jgi:hypothetical protein
MNILIFMIINHCFNNMKIIYLEKIYVNNVVLLKDIKIYKKIFMIYKKILLLKHWNLYNLE